MKSVQHILIKQLSYLQKKLQDKFTKEKNIVELEISVIIQVNTDALHIA